MRPAKKPTTKRYEAVSAEKAGGATYTPRPLAEFVARQMVDVFRQIPSEEGLRVLDPAAGDGQLLLSLLEILQKQVKVPVEVYGFETDPKALESAAHRIGERIPSARVHFRVGNFLDYVEARGDYDLVIANPPYVRTQILGSARAQKLARRFGLLGRVDLYHAFLLAIARVLQPGGVAGIIVPNRFMTTKSGSAVRSSLQETSNLIHIWDLGDTKLFDVAVLPALLLLGGRSQETVDKPPFTSIYETKNAAQAYAPDPIAALGKEGVVQVGDGRHFEVQHGFLETGGESGGVWRITAADIEAWLETVERNTWGTFGQIGKVRVGVKTCADKVFVRSDWVDFPDHERPQLLKSLTTHHIAAPFKARIADRPKQILYPYEIVDSGWQPADLSSYPRDAAYLKKHRQVLEGRHYVAKARRKWYEIWVQQDPTAWAHRKLVFRDIAEKPSFWIDSSGSVVNGDCYWMITKDPKDAHLLWLAAAVGNSTFISDFYDSRFHNKLYAGRRRFITQYVEQFPLPCPSSKIGIKIIDTAKAIYRAAPSRLASELLQELDRLVWEAFGFRSRTNPKNHNYER